MKTIRIASPFAYLAASRQFVVRQAHHERKFPPFALSLSKGDKPGPSG